MKILKIFGVVVGIHVFALILIFANPGCSSTSKPTPAPSDTLPVADTPPSIAVPRLAPAVTAPIGDRPRSSAPAIAFNPEAPAVAGGGSGPGPVRFTPTRPGTPVASTLVAEPVVDVTPATTYTVANGDNLWNLSKKFRVPAAEIAAANNLKTNAMIHPGQKLIIPGKSVSTAAAAPTPARATTAATGKTAETAAPKPPADAVKHVVKSGETLSIIAHKYGVKQGDIAVANNISDPQKIRAGMELTIPGWQTPAAKSGKAASKSGADSAAKSAAPKPAEIKSIFNPEPEASPAPTPAPAFQVPVIRVDDSPAPPAPKGP